MSILFISDTHLIVEKNNIYNQKNNILIQNQVISCLKYNNIKYNLSAVYLLGDIFNAWIGDEQINEQNEFILYLKELSYTCKIYFMHGNRDFLVSKKFAQYIPCTLLSDPHILNFSNKKILLTHGDLLCTDDKVYQRLRKILRNYFIQKLFLFLPYFIRYAIAKFMRKLSKKKQQDNKYKNIDINLKTLDEWYRKYSFNIIIHGHTHKTNIYQYLNYQRFVLSDWHIDGGTCAILHENELILKKFIL